MANNDDAYPIGKPGLRLAYRSKAKEMPGSLVRNFDLVLGSVEEHEGRIAQWFQLNAEKEDKQKFTVWILASAYPSASLQTAQEEILRYIVCR